MSKLQKIVFHVGGPTFHPTEHQAKLIMQWLGTDYEYAIRDGVAAFEALTDCDLLIVMGLHWTGISADNLIYRAPSESDRRAFEEYVRSGRPLLVHHGAAASYDDWPRFGELLGFTWVWGQTSHFPIGDYHIDIVATNHPIVEKLSPFDIHDELYYDVKVSAGLTPTIHATTKWQDLELPMIFTATGSRVEGAGKTVYLANGHDMTAFASPAMRQIWINAVHWLLSDTN